MGFDLLRDFWISISALDVRDVDIAAFGEREHRLIEDAVRIPMLRALEVAAGKPVALYEVPWLRTAAVNALKADEFCITLDHGVYFNAAQYEFDLTRSATDPRLTGSQNFVRRPRRKDNSVETQLRQIRGAFINDRKKKRIVVADDGIATGQTIELVIAECHGVNLRVDRIVVCCNNTGRDSVSRIPIRSLVPCTRSRPWLNERDLFWGLPRSGLSFAPPALTADVYGIPFSFDTRLVQQRIGIEDGEEQFWRTSLQINRVLWQILEKHAGRELQCEDCAPLRFIPEVLGLRHERIVTVLDRLERDQDALRLDSAHK